MPDPSKDWRKAFEEDFEKTWDEIQDAVEKSNGDKRVALELLGMNIDQFRTLANIKISKPFKLTDKPWFMGDPDEALAEAMKAKEEVLRMSSSARAKAREEASEAREIALREAKETRDISRRHREEARSQWEQEKANRQYKVTRLANVNGFSGRLAAFDDDDAVPNPEESYREPAIRNMDDLLDEAGLKYTKIVKVRPVNGHNTTPEELDAQVSLVEKLNSSQSKHLFVLEDVPTPLPTAAVKRPGFWARLFGIFRRKKASKR